MAEDDAAGADASPVRLAMAIGLTLVLVLGLLCAALGLRAFQAHRDQQLRAQLVEAARQEAVNLTTISYEHPEVDVKRILDAATGEFHDDFKNRSGPLMDVVKKVQSASAGTVTEAGLESVNGRQGQVLVAVTVKSSNAGNADPVPRFWRMRLTVTKQGSDTKVSKVEFAA